MHTVLYRATRGVVGRRLVDNDMLLLTTHGRKTARLHTVPLLYLTADERVVVIASYGGRAHYPDWYLNLTANPQVMVQLPLESRKRHLARTASPSERTEWWPRAIEAYHGYAVYQSRTEREIPVVFLERA